MRNSELYQKRVWELDAMRGFCIWCMLIDHSLTIFKEFGGYDIVRIYGFWFIKHYFGALFLVISGICVYFSHRTLKRGLVVLCCALSLTAATMWLYQSGRESELVVIRFGVLHAVGCCMLLYPLYQKLPDKLKLALGSIIVVAGYYCILNERVHAEWLFPIGLQNIYFCSWDYYPLMPHLGWFMIGNGLGSLLYHKTPKTLIPSVNTDRLLVRSLCWCGRNSLYIYMIHLPLLYVLAKMFAK